MATTRENKQTKACFDCRIKHTKCDGRPCHQCLLKGNYCVDEPKRVEDRIVHILSKRGIVRIVREDYVRIDINNEIKNLKETQKKNLDKTQIQPYAVLDDHVVRDFTELLESVEIKNLIIPQTLMRELKELSSNFYNRIRKITNDERKNSHVFSNEAYFLTHTEKKEDENYNKEENEIRKIRLRKAMISMTKLLSKDVNIIIVSNDKIMVNEAKDNGITVHTIKEYLDKYYSNISYLHDLHASLELVIEEKAKADQSTDTTVPTGYVEYESIKELEAGVKSNKYYRGKIEVSRRNPDESWVKLGEKLSVGKEIFIPNSTLRNRAIQGDTVVVSLLPTKDWIKDSEGPKATGKVVGILKSGWRPYVCTLQIDEKSTHSLAIPWDYRIPKIRLRTKQVSQLKTKRLVVRIDEWPVNSNYPSGHYVNQLGEIGERETEMAALLVEHQISSTPFTPSMLADLPSHASLWHPTEEEIRKRRDCRSWRVMSIDPLGSQDIDDALSVEKLSNGNIRIGCHIADVSYFVKENSLLDVEARMRGTSVYLSDRRIDMLPAILSESLCSLRSNQDRYAVSVVWDFDPKKVEIVDIWYGRTIIHSKHELYYEQAQKIINGSEEEKVKLGATVFETIRNDLMLLLKIFRKLHERRLALGALELESFEVRFDLDDKKNPVGVKTKKELEVMKMVAEYMILANCSVAKKIFDKYPSNSLLRRHPFPRLDAFEELIDLARIQGFEIDVSSNKALSESLKKATTKDSVANQLLRSMATIAMAEAEYFSTGSYEIHEFYHYGLATEFYTHFTSPIRRYADCIVHRQLLDIKESESGSTTLQDIATHLNLRNRASKSVQRASTELFHVLYFINVGDTKANGVISKVKENGFSIFLPNFGYKGTLMIKEKDGTLKFPKNAFSTSPDDYESNIDVTDCSYDPTTRQMIIQSNMGPISISVFDPVTVKVTVQESRAHLPSIRLELIHFGVNTQKKGINTKIQIDKKVIELEEQKKEELIILTQEEKQFAQTNSSESLYYKIQSFNENGNIVDPLEIVIPNIKFKKIGRRVFQEESYNAMQKQVQLKKSNTSGDKEEEGYYYYMHEEKKLPKYEPTLNQQNMQQNTQQIQNQKFNESSFKPMILPKVNKFIKKPTQEENKPKLEKNEKKVEKSEEKEIKNEVIEKPENIPEQAKKKKVIVKKTIIRKVVKKKVPNQTPSEQ